MRLNAPGRYEKEKSDKPKPRTSAGDTGVSAICWHNASREARMARRCWESLSEPLAPGFWEAELANVVWLTVRAGVMTVAVGLAESLAGGA